MTPYEALIIISAIIVGSHVVHLSLTRLITFISNTKKAIVCPQSQSPSTATKLLIAAYRRLCTTSDHSQLGPNDPPLPRGYLTAFQPRYQAATSPSKSHISHRRLRKTLHNVSNIYPDYIYTAPSTITQFPALYAKDRKYACTDDRQGGVSRKGSTTYNGEILHLHSDGSLHVTLHPSDAVMVVGQGWGKFHQLAMNSLHPLNSRPMNSTTMNGSSRLGRWLSPVPDGYVRLSAPRGDKEVEVVEGIIKAAVWYSRCKVAGTREGADEDMLVAEEEALLVADSVEEKS